MNDIAAISGERPNTVSNWRKRHPDFPAGHRNGRQMLFSRVEVLNWLQRHGRADHAAPDTNDDAAEVACALLCLAALAPDDFSAHVRQQPDPEAIAALSEVIERTHSLPGLLAPLRRRHATQAIAVALPLTVDERDRVRPRPQLAAAFDTLIDGRVEAAAIRQSRDRSPRWLGDLMFDLVADALKPGARLLDPAAGEGGFLVAAAGRARAPLTLYGWESDAENARLARQRLFVHGLDATIEEVDSLDAETLDPLEAAAVVCDPPLGLQVDVRRWQASDPRWREFAIPEAGADLAWVLLALHHLAPGGRAAVITSRRVLTTPRNDGVIRRRLLDAGLVEAVIVLPAGSILQTGVPTALWLLHRGETGASDDVLFLDASAARVSRRTMSAGSATAAATALADQVTTTLAEWRRDHRAAALQPGFSAARPVRSLVAGDAELDPMRLVRLPTNPGELSAELTRTRQRHEELLADLRTLATPSTRDEPPVNRRLSLGELRDTGRARIITGERTEAIVGGEGDGTPVLGSWSFRGEPPRRSPGATPVLEPGDVIIAPRARGFQSRVVRADEQGAALEAPLQAVRLSATHDDALTPSLLAELVNLQPEAVGTIGRQSVRAIEIPLLTPDAARELDAALGTLRREAELTAQLDKVRNRLRALMAEQLSDSTRPR